MSTYTEIPVDVLIHDERERERPEVERPRLRIHAPQPIPKKKEDTTEEQKRGVRIFQM